MPIPNYQSFFRPLLETMSDGKEWLMRNAQEVVADRLKLSPEDKDRMLPSGQQKVYVNRILWAKTYLKKAGAIDTVRRGVLKIAERGLVLLRQNPDKIDNKVLEQFDEFREFHYGKKDEQSMSVAGDGVKDNEQTPQEVMEASFQRLVNEVRDEILEAVKTRDDKFFEQLVIDLLVAMGYGGSIEDAGKALGSPGDAGIDGTIKEDRLGLDVIYIQAKRWTDTTVGRPEIQKFAGALQGQRANKGVFITTSKFSEEARDFAAAIGSKIVLIDGNELAKLMYEYNIGVSTVRKFEIKRLDSDFFEE